MTRGNYCFVFQCIEVNTKSNLQLSKKVGDLGGKDYAPELKASVETLVLVPFLDNTNLKTN